MKEITITKKSIADLVIGVTGGTLIYKRIVSGTKKDKIRYIEKFIDRLQGIVLSPES